MKFKLAISLMLGCAFWLQASSNHDDAPFTDEPAPRSASVAFVDAQPEELQSCSANTATASDSNTELDAADFAEIARIRAIVHEPPLSEGGKMLWIGSVEHLLKIAEGSELLEKSVTTTTSNGRLLTKQELQKKALESAVKSAEMIANIFNEKADKELEQGLSNNEMRSERRRCFLEIITDWPPDNT